MNHTILLYKLGFYRINRELTNQIAETTCLLGIFTDIAIRIGACQWENADPPAQTWSIEDVPRSQVWLFLEEGINRGRFDYLKRQMQKRRDEAYIV